METIGIIAAMTQESSAVLRLIKGWKRSMLGPFRSQRFRINDRDCQTVTSGMGLERAAQATRALIEAFHPQILVSVGIAGAVNADLGIGDVVMARNTCQLDQGKLGAIMPLAALSDSAWQASEEALRLHQARLFSGTAVSTHGSQFILEQPEEMPNPVLEMETVGIAQAAGQQGIPLLSLRSISDGPRAPIPFNLEAMLDNEYNLNTGRIIRTILGHPQMVPQLLKMGRNSNLAAANAAIALIAALSQPGPVISR